VNEGYSTAQMVAGLQILSRGFWNHQVVIFVTLQDRKIPYVEGLLRPSKVNKACHVKNLRFADIIVYIKILSTLLGLPKLPQSSSPGEFHPQALTETDVNL